TVAVKDMDEAKKFYGETLGLSKAEDNEDGGVTYETGSSTLFVYSSQYAGTNQATAVTFAAGDDLEKIVADLQGKGVKFEEYDGMPGVTRDGAIHKMEGGAMRSAWFKDPSGNIININAA